MANPQIPDSDDLAASLTEAKVWSQFYENYKPDYKISELLYGEPSNRKIRIIDIGAGLFGINLAYWISRMCKNFELTLFEKSNEVGGVWNYNRYPGVACDVPSHVYQYSYAPNPEWPRFLSSGEHIRKYLEKCSATFDLKKYIKFESTVLKSEWHEEGFWRVFVREKLSNGEYREYQQDAEILVNNSGSQHNYRWPDIEGLDKFKGKLLHTAVWDREFREEAWKDKTVCVIGSGASAVQVVPQMQPHVRKMTVFSRTSVWFAPGLAGDAFSPEYSLEEQERFKKDPVALQTHGKEIERKLNGLFLAFYGGSDHQKKAIKFFYDEMKIKIKDPKLLKGFTPDFVPGCRRITPGDPFIHAIQEPNAEVVFKGVTQLTEDGVIDSDGVERKCDIVVCATGFDVDLIPRFEVIGANGLLLSKVLGESPDSYMAAALPNFPNYFYGSTGAYWPSANGSLIGPMNTIAKYVVQVIQKMQVEHNIISLEPKQEAMEDFVEHAQTWLKGAAWSWNCPAWYKVQSGPLKGRVSLVWPGITPQFVKVLEKVRWEDYNIKYAATGKTRANRYLYLGNGLVEETLNPQMDDTPHVDLDAIDPRWVKAAGLTWTKGMRLLDEL